LDHNPSKCAVFRANAIHLYVIGVAYLKNRSAYRLDDYTELPR